MNVGLILNMNKYNKYSFAALVGALETDERLIDIPLFLVQNNLIRDINDALKQFDRVIVCYSFMSPQALSVYYEIKRLRSLFGNKIFLIAGGSYPTGDPNGALKMGFDICVVGEGEKTFPELVYRIVNGKEYEDLPGIGFKCGESIKINKASDIVDINLYPPFGIKHKLFAPIEISRGCPWSCKFCQTPRIFGFHIRHRSVECVVKYTRVAVNNGYKNFWFISPNAFAYGSPDGKEVAPDKIKVLLSSLRNVNGVEKVFFGTFPSEVRPDFVTSEVLDLVTRYASNTSIVIGAQSGSDRLLKLSGRGHSVNDVYKAVDLTLSAGLTPNLDFIFCLPDENEEDLDRTKSVVEEFVKKGARIHAHVFIPLHGTPYQNEKPKMLDKETRRWLSNLAKRGVVEGYWSQHIKFGKDILKFNKLIREI
ncbi:MAG: TIGR04013 family B12-binding domain/radical SAM domain-containing protein [Archaeoglobaceae archaeon]